MKKTMKNASKKLPRKAKHRDVKMSDKQWNAIMVDVWRRLQDSGTAAKIKAVADREGLSISDVMNRTLALYYADRTNNELKQPKESP